MPTSSHSVRSFLGRALLLLAAALALVGIAAGPATAATMTLPSGKVLKYAPVRSDQPPEMSAFDLAFHNLDYNGGPVMPSNTNYTIYWSPSGLSAFPAGYANGVDQYFVDLAHDSTLSQASGGAGRQNVESVATQYNDSNGNVAAYDSHFGGRIVDTQPYPANGCSEVGVCLTTAQMEAEISRVVASGHLPKDIRHQYFLITPPNVESCTGGTPNASCSAGSTRPLYCAFHGSIGPEDSPIIYSVDNYVTGVQGCDGGTHPNGDSDGLISGGLSHEHNEAITDPLVNVQTAWADTATGLENGDKCDRENGAQVINGRTYWYQPEWSNFTGQCLYRLPFAPMPLAASFTTTRISDTTATLTAITDAGPGAKYVWIIDDAFTPIETDSPTITHEFPFFSYNVALTVMRADGMSRGAAGQVFLGTTPAAAFTAPSDVLAGDDATFDASGSTTTNGAITDYRWGWGDGSADGSGVSVSHRFSTSGTYAVSLTVTDRIGLTSTATHQIVVAPRPSAPAAQSRSLTVRSTRPSYTRRSVVITSAVTLPGAGTVVARGTTTRGARRTTRCNSVSHIDSAGTYTFRCTLGPASRTGLRHRPLTLRMAITFIPDGGPSTVWSHIITLGRHT